MKRWLSLLLCLCLCLSLFPAQVFALEETESTVTEEAAPAASEEASEIETDAAEAAEASAQNEMLDAAAAEETPAAEPEIIASGTCGENLTWTLDENGLLTISGTGKMNNFNCYTVGTDYWTPWIGRRSTIKAVVIEEGVTTIGNYAFATCAIRSISIPSTVTEIYVSAFEFCSSLEEITVDADNASFTVIDGVLFNKDVTTLYRCSTAKQGSYTIPESVTKLEYGGNTGAFANCAALTSVTIPQGVTTIPERTFYRCSALESVSVPQSVTSIGSYAFQDCSALESVSIPQNVTSIGNYAFAYCSALESISIPQSVTYIGDHAFYSCSSLKRIDLPDQLKELRESTFSNCSSLEYVTISESVTSIGGYCFGACPNLRSFDVAEGNPSFKSVDGVLLSKDGTQIKEFPMGWEGAYAVPDGVTSIARSQFGGCKLLTSVTLPDSVTSIGGNAFSNCSALQSVTIPITVTQIGKDAFSGCSGVDVYYPGTPAQWRQINEALPTTVNVHYQDSICGDNLRWALSEDGTLTISGIGEMYNYSESSPAPWYAQRGSVRKLVIEAGVTGVGQYALYGCSALTDVSLAQSVKYLHHHSFEGCSALTEITVPGQTREIGDYVFAGCTALERVNLKYGVEFTGYYAFQGCVKLKSFVMTETVSRIPESCFDGCGALEVTFYGTEDAWNEKSEMIHLPEGSTVQFGFLVSGSCGENLKWVLDDTGTLTITGSGEMNDYQSDNQPWAKYKEDIRTVDVRNGATSIGKNAFYGLSNLERVNLPDTVKKISENALRKTGISSLVFPAALTEIGADAFAWTNLKSVVIPEGVTSIYSSAFYCCPELEYLSIPASAENIFLNPAAGCDKLKTIDVAADNPNYKSVDGVLLSKDGTQLISFPGGKDGAYTVPNGVTEIKSFSFELSRSLQSVTFPETVTTIEGFAFRGCSALETVTIPASVVTIEDTAFAGCGLKDIYYAGCEAEWMNLAGNVPTNAAVHYGSETSSIVLDSGSCGAWGDNLTWVQYLDGRLIISGSGDMASGSIVEYVHQNKVRSVTLPDGLTSIGDYAFQQCSNLKEITIPNGVKQIGNCAFEYCDSLTGVVIPESVTSIGMYAFSECDALKFVVVPANVTSIGSGAFSGCSAACDLYFGGTAEEWSRRYASPLPGKWTLHAVPGLITGGRCGEKLFWALAKDGTLFLDGSGAMDDYSEANQPPWSARKNDVRSVFVGRSVTGIGSGAFSGCTALEKVYIPGSTLTVGSDSFQGVTAAVYYFQSSLSGTAQNSFGGTLSWFPAALRAACKQLPVYSGEAQQPDVLVTWADLTLQQGTDYTVSYSNNVNAGSDAVINVQGGGNYTGRNVSTRFTIRTRDISFADVSVSDRTYTGSALKPSVTVELDGETLPASAYTCVYLDNCGLGRATVQVFGCGNYSGMAEGGFQIKPSSDSGTIHIDLSTTSPSIKTYSRDCSTLTVRFDKGQNDKDPYIKVTHGGSSQVYYSNEVTLSFTSLDAGRWTFEASCSVVVDQVYNMTTGWEYKYKTAKGGCVVDVTIPSYHTPTLQKLELNAPTFEGIRTVYTSVKPTPEGADLYGLKWTSSDTSVATVYDGIVTLLKPGKCTITASAGGKSATLNLDDIQALDITQAHFLYYNAAAGKAHLEMLGEELIPDVDFKLTTENKGAFTCLTLRGIGLFTGTLTVIADNSTGVEFFCAHNLVRQGAAAATCTKDGYSGDVVCKTCGAVIQTGEVIKATGHDTELKNAEDATCTRDGYTGDEVCRICGEIVKKGSVIKASHDTELKNAVDATCTRDGYTGDEVCRICGEIVKKGSVIKADHKWDAGKVTKQPTETAEGVKTFTCTVCGETRTEAIPKLTPPAPKNPFVDVKQGEYYYDPVLWAVNHQPQITNGTSATTFSPDATCTRGQVVTFLWRAKGCPEPKSTNNPFTDVEQGSYYYKAVLWANENNITNGTGVGTFSPDAPCTRAHVVTFLWRTANKPAAGSGNPFRDVPAGEYYTNAVLWAVNHKPQITNGTGPDTFSPDSPCTRGQIVTFLYRYLK